MQEATMTPEGQRTNLSFLAGGGEMGERIRNFQWHSTSIGSPENWPQSLRSAISICLNSNFPIAIYWGNPLTLIYNDGWSSIPGAKHPWALGKDAKQVWPEIWTDIEPQFEKAFRGEPGGSNDALLPMQRHGYTEECYFDFTFTPIYGESGKVEGVFNAVIETTYRVLNERRSNFLKDLTVRLSACNNQEEVMQHLVSFVSRNNKSVPFCFVYKKEGAETSLITSSVDDPFKYAGTTWPFAEAGASDKLFYIERLADHMKAYPAGFWPEDPVEGIIIPCRANDNAVTFFLVLGVNPRRRYDLEFKVFFETLSDIVNSSLRSIESIETERRKAEALAEIDKAKTIFFSNISHEFRTPLTLMLGSIEEAIKEPNIAPANVPRLQMAQRNAMRLMRMVNNLLDFSRIEAGRMYARFELTDIGAYTRDLASGFTTIMENAGLAFEINCEYIVQPVYVDRTMWEKIVLNLLSNAFKYTLKGKVTLSLTMGSNDQVKMTVKDSGVGIPEKELPHMFERFHRVSGTGGRTNEGTGIGLSLISELVKMHGGAISVSSQLNKGSEFTITIPTGNKHLEEKQIVENKSIPGDIVIDNANTVDFANEAKWEFEEANAEPIEQTGTHKTMVLVVDDNNDLRTYISNLLRDEHDVMTANNGLDALHKLQERIPDLILTDIMMPVMDGVQLLKALKENLSYSSIPVIFLTARAGEESKIEGYELGADDYLIKPFSKNELKARIAAQIRIGQKRERLFNEIYSIFDEVPFGIVVLKGEEFIVEFFNQYSLDTLQQKKEAVIGKSFFEVSPDSKENLEYILKKVYQSGKRFTACEMPVSVDINNTVETRYFDSVIDSLPDDQGRITGLLATSIDVTDQVLARRKIEESRTEMKRLANAMPQLVWIAEANGDVTFYNERYKEFSGIKRIGEGKWSWSAILHPDDLQGTAKAWEHSVQTKTVYESEHRLMMKDGSYRWHLSRGLPFLDENGNVIKWYGTATDIHQFKLSEKELQMLKGK